MQNALIELPCGLPSVLYIHTEDINHELFETFENYINSYSQSFMVYMARTIILISAIYKRITTSTRMLL